MSTVLVTGGAGYVGSALIPKLIAAGHTAKVLDLYLYGDDVLAESRSSGRLIEIKGDMRSADTVREAVSGCDAVIHLACISNDPSFELDPNLGKSINFDCFPLLVSESKKAGVKRFIYASSSSVYGVKEVQNVTEDLELEPLTDYSKYKAMCEEILLAERAPGFAVLVLRPATVCGYAPRLRLDLAVNILTTQAVSSGKVTVFGGTQMRPNIHIEDVSDLYVESLKWPAEKIDGGVYNAGYYNHTVGEIAAMVKKVVGEHVVIETQPSSDLRSYHISSEKIRRELGFTPSRTVEDGIRDLVGAFKAGKIPDPLVDPKYYNIKTMQKVNLK